ncbi:MAG: hypothetical protein H7336_06015 [Bacteriovorax sp.]|nr:hypothetical protein [Bacteriovorax sp.]
MHSNRFALFITARLGSKRLPNKHIIDMGGVRPIELLIRRLKILGLPIVVTTGDEPINYGFKEICKNEEVQLFFGEAENIPLRHLQAAKELNYDFIFAIDGDDLLTAPEGVMAIVKKIQNEDFSKSFYNTSGFPFGMNSSGYSKTFLETAINNFKGENLETGWGRIFSKESVVVIPCESKNADNWRLSLDYDEDFAVFKNIWMHFKSDLITASSKEVLEYFDKNEVYKLNQTVIEKYWENFQSERSKEIQKELK